jgi:hypothetical protein
MTSRDSELAAKVHSALFTLESAETAAASVHTIKLEAAGRSSNIELIGNCFFSDSSSWKNHMLWCFAPHIIS